jgi:hypothetical protein
MQRWPDAGARALGHDVTRTGVSYGHGWFRTSDLSRVKNAGEEGETRKRPRILGIWRMAATRDGRRISSNLRDFSGVWALVPKRFGGAGDADVAHRPIWA